MNLFSKIFSSLLVGIIGLLIIIGNLYYEAQIRQFDADMVANAQAVGRVLAGVIVHVWAESGAEMAVRQIEGANQADPEHTIRWVRLDDVRRRFAGRQPVPTIDALDTGQPLTFIAFDENRKRRRYTFIPVLIPGERRGVLEITQSLAPLVQYTQKVLVQTLLISAILALVSGSVVYFLIYTKIRKPLEKLSRKAMEIGKGNLSRS